MAKELLAIVERLKFFQKIIFGLHIKVFTDNTNLTFYSEL